MPCSPCSVDSHNNNRCLFYHVIIVALFIISHFSKLCFCFLFPQAASCVTFLHSFFQDRSTTAPWDHLLFPGSCCLEILSDLDRHTPGSAGSLLSPASLSHPSIHPFSSAYPGPGRGGSCLSRDTQTSLSPDNSSSSSGRTPRRSQAS